MKFHELPLSKNKNKKRVGRGTGSGHGKTAGRGTKGQNARSGGGVPLWFEGGQTSIIERLPKQKGFSSWRTKPQEVKTGDLNRFKGKVVTVEKLFEQNIIEDDNHTVKVITGGNLSKKLTVKLQNASKGAIERIEAAGGSFEPTRLKRGKKKDDQE